MLAKIRAGSECADVHGRLTAGKVENEWGVQGCLGISSHLDKGDAEVDFSSPQAYPRGASCSCQWARLHHIVHPREDLNV